MGIGGKAMIAGAYEHPGRILPDRSTAQIHAEVAVGALGDAGLALADVDGYFCSGDAPGFGGLSMADHLGLQLSYLDTTEMGGSSYVAHVGHAAAAIAAGKCSVALITLAGRPRQEPVLRSSGVMGAPEASFETVYGPTTVSMYALAARRHMYEFGTTSEQLAEVKVAASLHAQHNPNALLRTVVTVEEVVASRLVSDPWSRSTRRSSRSVPGSSSASPTPERECRWCGSVRSEPMSGADRRTAVGPRRSELELSREP